MTWKRIAPLSGLAFVVLNVITFVAVGGGGTNPQLTDSGATIAAFYSTNHTKAVAAADLLVVVAALLAVFVAVCRPRLRDTGRVWSALFFGGGLIAAANLMSAAGIHVALADSAANHLDPAVLQALNAIDSPIGNFTAGIGIMLLGAAGAMIPLAGALRWLGWIALVLGVVDLTPAGIPTFPATAIWIAVVSILLTVRTQNITQPASALATSPGDSRA